MELPDGTDFRTADPTINYEAFVEQCLLNRGKGYSIWKKYGEWVNKKKHSREGMPPLGGGGQKI